MIECIRMLPCVLWSFDNALAECVLDLESSQCLASFLATTAEAALTIARLGPISTLPLIAWLHHNGMELIWQLDSSSTASHVCIAVGICMAEQVLN